MPTFLEDDIKLLLQKAKEIKQKAKHNKKSGLHKCPFCLQCYLSHTQLLKHQKRKRDCIKGNFILKTIATLPKFESILDILVDINYSQENVQLIEAIYDLKSLFLQPTESALLIPSIDSIEGPLIDKISNILVSLKPGQAIQQFTDIDGVTTDTINTLLHGVYLNHNTQRRINIVYDERKAWLQDQHIEIFRLLLSQKFNCPSFTSLQTPIMLSSQIYKELHIADDKNECKVRLKEYLIKKGILYQDHIQFEEILLPVNLNNNHWILFYINTHSHTYCPINPFSPSQPQENDLLIANTFMKDFTEILGAPEYFPTVPQITLHFPKQIDGFNCGIYILLYTLGFFTPNLVTKEGFPFTPMEYRVWMAAWFLARIPPNINGKDKNLENKH